MSKERPLFELEPDPVVSDVVNRNPCIRVYGKHPTAKTCRGCLHLYRKQMSKVYFKCLLRTITSGPATDHRIGWDACSKWIKATKCPECEGKGYIWINDHKDKRKPGGPAHQRCALCRGRGKVAAEQVIEGGTP